MGDDGGSHAAHDDPAPHHFQEFIVNHTNKWPFSLSSPVRVACTAAAAICAASVNLGLLGLFDIASSEAWVNPTPQVLQAQAQCDALPARNARERCTREVVARALAPGLHTAQTSAR